MNVVGHDSRTVVGAVPRVPAPSRSVEGLQERGQHFDPVDHREEGLEVVRGEAGQRDLPDAGVEGPSGEDLGSEVGLCSCSKMGQGRVDSD